MVAALDESCWPLVVLTVSGHVDAAARREYFALLDSVLSRERPFVFIQVHTHDVAVVDGAAGQDDMAQGLADRQARLARLCRGLVGVVV